MRRFLGVGFVSIMLALVAPAAPVPKHLMKEPVYYHPITEGAKWVYGDDLVLVVSKVEESHGKKVVSIERVEGQQRSLHDVVEVSPAGLVRLAWGTEKLNPPDVLLKTPFKKGDSWTFDSPTSGMIAGSKGICTIVGVETIKTPAGSFEAVRVNVDYQIELGNGWKKQKLIAWYAPNVGLVKMIDDDDRVIWLLKSFTPGKK